MAQLSATAVTVHMARATAVTVHMSGATAVTSHDMSGATAVTIHNMFQCNAAGCKHVAIVAHYSTGKCGCVSRAKNLVKHCWKTPGHSKKKSSEKKEFN